MTTPSPGEARDLRIREASRAILLTPDHDVLLVRFEFPAGTRWAVPGGGIHPGETPHEALRRELREEVGLEDVDIGPHVWTRLHVFPFLNGLYDAQRDVFHLVRVPARFEPRPQFTWEELNAEFVFELRWWTIDEIHAAETVFAPRTLGVRLTELVSALDASAPTDWPLAVEA